MAQLGGARGSERPQAQGCTMAASADGSGPAAGSAARKMGSGAVPSSSGSSFASAALVPHALGAKGTRAWMRLYLRPRRC